MQTVPSLNITYTEEKGYVTADIAEREGLHKLNLSGTKFRQMLRGGEKQRGAGGRERGREGGGAPRQRAHGGAAISATLPLAPRAGHAGDDIPEWFAFKSVVRVLREETPVSDSE